MNNEPVAWIDPYDLKIVKALLTALLLLPIVAFADCHKVEVADNLVCVWCDVPSELYCMVLWSEDFYPDSCDKKCFEGGEALMDSREVYWNQHEQKWIAE